MATDMKLFHQYGRCLVHRYRIYKDPLPHVSLRGMIIRKLSAFVNQAMAVARWTGLHLSIPSSGTTSRLDGALFGWCTGYSGPLRQPSRPTATVSFATGVEVIEYMPVRSSPMEELGSPDLLQPGQKFSILTPRGDISHQGLVAITIATTGLCALSIC